MRVSGTKINGFGPRTGSRRPSRCTLYRVRYIYDNKYTSGVKSPSAWSKGELAGILMLLVHSKRNVRVIPPATEENEEEER